MPVVDPPTCSLCRKAHWPRDGCRFIGCVECFVKDAEIGRLKARLPTTLIDWPGTVRAKDAEIENLLSMLAIEKSWVERHRTRMEKVVELEGEIARLKKRLAQYEDGEGNVVVGLKRRKAQRVAFHKART